MWIITSISDISSRRDVGRSEDLEGEVWVVTKYGGGGASRKILGILDPALCPRFQRLCIHLRRMRLCCKMSSTKTRPSSRSLIFPLKIVASISAKIWGGGRLDPALCPRFQRLRIHLRRTRLCCKMSSAKTHPSSRSLIFPLKIVASFSAKIWGGGRLDRALCSRFQRPCIHLRRTRLCCKMSSTKTHPSSRSLIFPLKIVAVMPVTSRLELHK